MFMLISHLPFILSLTNKVYKSSPLWGFNKKINSVGNQQLQVIENVGHSSSSRLHSQPQQFGLTDEDYIQRLSKWILVVDDEESIRTAVGQYLSDQGYRVTACKDAKTALEVCTSTTSIPGKVSTGGITLPDAIVSDIRMPGGMDGIQFLQRVRQDPLLQSIPVVLLTAKGLTQDRIEGYQAGADAYLPKPFNPEELLSILDNVIQRFTTLNGDNVAVDRLQQEMEEIKSMVLSRNTSEEDEVFLTSDERFVLSLLGQGLTNKEIASEIELSQRRVEQHITSMFRKAHVVNRTELVRWAIAEGLINF